MLHMHKPVCVQCDCSFQLTYCCYVNVHAAGADCVGIRWAEGTRGRRPLWLRCSSTDCHHQEILQGFEGTL